MRTAKRILAMVLILVIALTAVPLTASAGIADTAVAMVSGKQYTKTLNYRHDHNYVDYKIVVTGNGNLVVNLNSTNKYICLELYDNNFNRVEVNNAQVSIGEVYRGGEGYNYVGYYWNETGETITAKTTWSVKKGTYYLRADNSTDSYGYMSSTGKITLTATYPSTAGKAAKITYLSATITKGSTLQMGTVLSPANGATVTWKSNNPKVAYISSDGLITAKAKGATYISATCGSSKRWFRIIVK